MRRRPSVGRGPVCAGRPRRRPLSVAEGRSGGPLRLCRREVHLRRRLSGRPRLLLPPVRVHTLLSAGVRARLRRLSGVRVRQRRGTGCVPTAGAGAPVPVRPRGTAGALQQPSGGHMFQQLRLSQRTGMLLPCLQRQLPAGLPRALSRRPEVYPSGGARGVLLSSLPAPAVKRDIAFDG